MARFLVIALGLTLAAPLLAAIDDAPRSHAPQREAVIGESKPVFLGSMTVTATPLPAR